MPSRSRTSLNPAIFFNKKDLTKSLPVPLINTDAVDGTSLLCAFCTFKFLASIGKSRSIVYSLSETTNTHSKVANKNAPNENENFSLKIKLIGLPNFK